MTREWYDDHRNIAALLRYLEERCELSGVDEALALVEKPWKYTPEFNAMCRAERAAEVAA
jgi:hypothetical protein